MNTLFLKYGLLLGEISTDEILAWSDKNIMDDRTDELFVDLSTLSSKNEEHIIKILKQYEKEASEEQQTKFEKVLFGFLIKDITNWKLIQTKLMKYFEISNNGKINYDNEFSIRLKDDYFLRKDGFTGSMEMPQELREYLEQKVELEYENTSFLEVLNNEL